MKYIISIFFLTFSIGPAIALDTSSEEQTCVDIGFKRQTEPFANCVLQLLERRDAGERNRRLEDVDARQQADAQKRLESCKKNKKAQHLDSMSCSLRCLTYQIGSAKHFACNDDCKALASLIRECN
jgi:hypothetical protein